MCSHSFLTLPIHLLNERYIVFQEEDDAQVLDVRISKLTKLEAWFELNRSDASAHRIRYIHVPEYYVWDNKTTKWVRRSPSQRC